MRKLLQFQVGDAVLNGTYHVPAGLGEQGPHPSGRIGFLFWNPGFVPRSSIGDLAAHLADHLAGLGFHAFRFDMPGLGDSQGDVPTEVLQIFQMIQEGGHLQHVLALKCLLVREFNLKGLIYVGHCGSATTAVYAAERDRTADLLGCVLLDPSFIWYRLPGENGKHVPDSHNWLSALRKKAYLFRRMLRAWMLQSPGGQTASALYARLKLLNRRLSGSELPFDANLRLLNSYRNLLARKFPLLVLTVPPSIRKADDFDYVRYLSRERVLPHFTRHEINGTDHSLVAGEGESAVREHLLAWLQSLAIIVDGAPGKPMQAIAGCVGEFA